MALAGAEPADARGKALEVHALSGEAEPAVQPVVIREQFEHCRIGPRDVLRIAAQRDPPEWSTALAELIADVCGDESRVCERVGEASRCAPGRAASCRSRTPRRRGAGIRPSPRSGAPSIRASGACTRRDRSSRSVAASSRLARRGCTRSAGRVRWSGRSRRRSRATMRAARAAPRRRWRIPRPTAHDPLRARRRTAAPRRRACPRPRRRSRCRGDAGCARDPRRCRARHRRSSSPRGVARRPCRRAPTSRRAGRSGSRRSACGPLPRKSRTCPGGCPGCRCRSTTRRSSARTSSAPSPRGARTPPMSPSAGPGASWRSALAVPARACGRRRPACPTAPAGSRRRAASGASRRWRRSIPRSAPRGRCRRRRPANRGPRRPPGRGCS